MKFEIKVYDESMRQAFEQLFIDYARSDLGDDLSPEILREKIVPLFLNTWEKGAGSIAIAFADGSPAGFACWQVDSRESDWCKRPGWGLIREFCVVPGYRRLGLGTQMAACAEEKLRQQTDKLYLTANAPEKDGGAALRFWTACGWRETGEINQNGTHTMEK